MDDLNKEDDVDLNNELLILYLLLTLELPDETILVIDDILDNEYPELLNDVEPSLLKIVTAPIELDKDALDKETDFTKIRSFLGAEGPIFEDLVFITSKSASIKFTRLFFEVIISHVALIGLGALSPPSTEGNGYF